MNQTARDDFFTLIHKGLRRELFGLTTLAGTIDWDDPVDVSGFAARWHEIHHLLEIHAAHEDDFFFPLLAPAAPEALAGVGSGHQEQEQALRRLADIIDAAVASPTPATGLQIHRELSAFVAGYLLHLLEEETVVMPAIWQHCSDEELARTRRSFLAAMPPADAALSRRVMLPAMSPPEREAMLRIVQATAPAPVLAAILDDARQLLPEPEWERLASCIAS